MSTGSALSALDGKTNVVNVSTSSLTPNTISTNAGSAHSLHSINANNGVGGNSSISNNNNNTSINSSNITNAPTKFDIEEMINYVIQCKPLSEEQLIKVCAKGKEVLQKESNVHSVQAPVTVCGDIHGQFHDML
uniref:Serine/threonine-protein phosphatase PP2A catalytic subunit n=1 Tax=Lygus hesperus TaxID=30085 RepID=A0A0A9XHC7_LYGHE